MQEKISFFFFLIIRRPAIVSHEDFYKWQNITVLTEWNDGYPNARYLLPVMPFK